MKSSLLAAAVLLALTARTFAQPIDFDQGVNLHAFMAQALAAQVDSTPPYKTACETLTLDGTTDSISKELVSPRYAYQVVEEPYDEYSSPRFHQKEVGRFTTRINIIRHASNLHPWEKETVSACVTGSELTVKMFVGANHYKTVSTLTPIDANSQAVTYALYPIKKLPMAPDPKGITVTDMTVGNGFYSFKALDKWASYYTGEQVLFTATIFENVAEYPDGQDPDQTVKYYHRPVTQSRLRLNVADKYRLDFAMPEQSDRNYFISVSFSRIGSVSTDQEVEAAVFPLK